jgi:hypothetical protein
MMKHLKRLVIAYDNMPTDMRGDLLTFREIIKNLDWLVIMSFHSVEVEEKRRDKAKKRVSTGGDQSSGRNSSDDVSSSYTGKGAPPSSRSSNAGTEFGNNNNDAYDTASMASYGSVGSRGSTRSFSAKSVGGESTRTIGVASTTGSTRTIGGASTASSAGPAGRRRAPGVGSKASPYAAFAAASEEQGRRSSAM